MTGTLIQHGESTERRFRMSYDDYAQFVDASTHSEWVDGEVTIFMSASERHQRLQIFLATLLNVFVRFGRLGTVLTEPFEMLVRSGRSALQPDILVILAQHEHWLDGKRLHGSADLAVEILSEESVTRDGQTKFSEYEAVGVPEYWIVDGRDGSRGVIAYARTEAGRYEAIAPDERGRIHSRVLPGFWVETDWLTADELPDDVAVWRQLLPGLFRA